MRVGVGRTTCDRLVCWGSPSSFIRLLTTVVAGKPSAEWFSWLPPRRLAPSRRALALLYAATIKAMDAMLYPPLTPHQSIWLLSKGASFVPLAIPWSDQLFVSRSDRDNHTPDAALGARGIVGTWERGNSGTREREDRG